MGIVRVVKIRSELTKESNRQIDYFIQIRKHEVEKR